MFEREVILQVSIKDFQFLNFEVFILKILGMMRRRRKKIFHYFPHISLDFMYL